MWGDGASLQTALAQCGVPCCMVPRGSSVVSAEFAFYLKYAALVAVLLYPDEGQ